MAVAQLYQFPQEEAITKVASTRRPSFQFYPGDWRRDPALRTCSMAAKGFWIELMCVMHESEEYGYLVVAGKAMDAKDIAKLLGETPTFCKKMLEELEKKCVFSRDSRGVIYSRRMIKDESIRAMRAAAGSLGGNPKLKGDLVKQKVKQMPKQNPTPSSSSSSSTSINSVAKATAAAPQVGSPAGNGEVKQKTPEELAKQELWRSAVALLDSQGIDGQQARTLIGKLSKDYGTDIVLEAVRNAVATQPADARAWLVTACKGGGVKRVPKAENFANKDYGNDVGDI